MRFDSYHPTINLIYFVTVIGCTIAFKQPVFLLISYICAFAYSVKLGGAKALVFDLILIPFIFAYSAFYSYYNHFGVTNLRENFAGNEITLEAVIYGLVIGVIAASVIMWMSCFFAIFSSDKVTYLFGRISPRLSLFLSIIFRSVPRIKSTARKINIAQTGIGKGLGQGNPIKQVINGVRLISIMITWTMESFMQSSESMKSRGYTLKGRTAFSIYRFDNRDRAFVVVIFLCLTVIMMATMLNQVNILYNPEIIMNRTTWVSYVFYIFYAMYLLLPMGLQVISEVKFRKCVHVETVALLSKDIIDS